MPSRVFRVMLATAVAIALSAGAHADVVTLKDGTKLEGTLIEEREDEIIFEHSVGGTQVRSTFKKEDLKSVEKTFEGGTKAVPRSAPESGDSYPEAAGAGVKTVMIVLDRSGSMSIGGRFEAALDEVEQIVAALNENARFGIYTFDQKPVSLFREETLRPTSTAKKTLRSKIKAVGLNSEGFTDIHAALRAALDRRCDTVYLLTDGIVTAGQLSIDRIVTTIVEIARRQRICVHVVRVHGGKYEFCDIEDHDAAQRGLSAIASETGGKYREVEVKLENPTTLKPGAQPIHDEVKFFLYNRGRRFFARALHRPTFQVEVEDKALLAGGFILEYSPDIRVDLRVVNQNGVVFDELRGVKLTYKNGRLWTPQTIKVVRPNDLSEGSRPDARDAGVLRVKAPLLGGLIEVIYRRGGREHKFTLIVNDATWVE